MQVGRMRYRIEIQDYKSTQDADGFETREWMTVHTVWADIAPVSGKEYMASNKETAEIVDRDTADEYFMEEDQAVTMAEISMQ